MKVYEFARELGIETIALMDKVKEWKLPVKSHMSALDDDMIEKIKKKMSESSEKSASTKKKKAKTKKKAAKKKTTAKKATSKKKVTKKKVSTVKKVSSKAAVAASKVKKADTASASATATKEEAVKPVTSKRVIRRKAGEAPPTPIVVEAKKPTPAASEEVVNETSQATNTLEASKAESSETPAKKTGQKVQRVFGKSIVGKIDLSKVKSPHARGNSNNRSGAGSPSAAGSRTAQRGIRPGFVAPSPSFPPPQSTDTGRRRDAKAGPGTAIPPKKKPGAGQKDQPTTAFKAADFRKREMIFQPKRKRVSFVPGKKTEITTPAAHKRVLKVNETMKVSDMAQEMGLKVPALMKVLVKQGTLVKMHDELDFDTISLIVPELGWEAENIHESADDFQETMAFGNVDAEPIPRAPVVTVMGHVDHGKTTLLDSIRNANVVSGEAGGITQHIGAYRVFVEKEKPITFIDTPGHAAFTEMRARGANITDIVILVVAADDGMMPQTEEAISHAKAAGVPIIVAINKMDKEGANPDRIMQQLTEKELMPEEWGGQTITQKVSAIKGEGIKELLESVWLQSEVLELKANPDRSASGVVIESKVEKGKGIVATLLVKEGTVKTGDSICVGTVAGKVRRLMDDQGKVTKTAGPSVPVEIMGLPDSPKAGDQFDVTESDQLAVELAEKRKIEIAAEAKANEADKMSLDVIFAKVKNQGVKELPLILKTDVAGSIEAVTGMVSKIESEEVKVNFIHKAVGGISESDILLASTAGGIVLGFNVRPDSSASRIAKERNVEVKCYRIIYELLDDLKKAMSGMLDPDIVEKEQGRAEVREVFSIPKMGTIAGSYVVDGAIKRNNLVRLIREGRVIYEGKLSSLKRFKDDAKEVKSGFECGIGIENYNDLKVGDVIEAFKKEEVAREL